MTRDKYLCKTKIDFTA